MPRSTDRRYRNHVTRERRRLEKDPSLAVCWLCGDPIDMELPVLHPRAFTCDHIVPIGRAGDLHGETKPAHRECNSSRGKGRNSTNNSTLLEW